METRPTASPKGSRQHWPWIAFVWGLAEATFFFVVPDVFITRLALRSPWRRVLLACGCALAGALIGGTLLWFAAQNDAAPALLRTFARLPGINRDLVVETGFALHEHGNKAMFTGGLIGQPYKLFAVHAAAQQVPLMGFLLFSAAARLMRFVLTAAIARLAAFGLHRWPESKLLRAHTLVWLCFYTVYFLLIR
jgi:membrane protein YqaA with SNARE-associated domain